MTARALEGRGTLRHTIVRCSLLAAPLVGAALALWPSPVDAAPTPDSSSIEAAPTQDSSTIETAEASCQEAIQELTADMPDEASEWIAEHSLDGDAGFLSIDTLLPYHTYGDDTVATLVGEAIAGIDDLIMYANPVVMASEGISWAAEQVFSVELPTAKDAYDYALDKARQGISELGDWVSGDFPWAADRAQLRYHDKAIITNGQCIPAGFILKPCRDENDYWPDDTGIGVVGLEDPDWWLEEIDVETESDEGDSCELMQNPPANPCVSDQEYLDGYRENGGDQPGVTPVSVGWNGLMPDSCWGFYPTSRYEVSWNEGSNWDPGNWDDNLLGFVTSFSFGLAKGAVQVALWLVDFGFTFDVGQYAETVGKIGAQYEDLLVVPFGLHDIVWFVLFAWVAIVALRGRLGVAGGEVLMTLVLLTLVGTLYAGRVGYMRSVVDVMDKSSSALLVAANGQDPTVDQSLDEAITPLGREVHRQFVELPYMYLNWGEVPDDDGLACRQAADHVLSTGWDRGGWPDRHMRRAGANCAEMADYNKDATNTRAFGAVLTVAVALFVAFTLAVTAFTVLVSKFLVAVLFAVMPFVLLSAVLPGAGRRLV